MASLSFNVGLKTHFASVESQQDTSCEGSGAAVVGVAVWTRLMMIDISSASTKIMLSVIDNMCDALLSAKALYFFVGVLCKFDGGFKLVLVTES